MKINLEILSSSYLCAPKAVEALKTKELVPKMVLRRRLTRASKLALEVMNTVNFSKGRIVYSTGYGELLATQTILNSILNKEGISPTVFQNSVYNTAVSYASILHKNENEILTVSSGKKSGEKLLKVGAIKALDGDTILLLATETLNIENIEEMNSDIAFLESAVALKVKVTQEKATLKYPSEISNRFPQSIALLIDIAKSCQKNQKNVIEICL